MMINEGPRLTKRDDRKANKLKEGAPPHRPDERCHRCGEMPQTALMRDPITRLHYCEGCLYFIELARGLKVIFGKTPAV